MVVRSQSIGIHWYLRKGAMTETDDYDKKKLVRWFTWAHMLKRVNWSRAKISDLGPASPTIPPSQPKFDGNFVSLSSRFWYSENLLRSVGQQRNYGKAKSPSNPNCGQKALVKRALEPRIRSGGGQLHKYWCTLAHYYTLPHAAARATRVSFSRQKTARRHM